MELIYEIKIRTKTTDDKYVLVEGLDKFTKRKDANTYVEEYAKRHAECELKYEESVWYVATKDEESKCVKALWKNEDGTLSEMYVDHAILFNGWDEYKNALADVRCYDVLNEDTGDIGWIDMQKQLQNPCV